MPKTTFPGWRYFSSYSVYCAVCHCTKSATYFDKFGLLLLLWNWTEFLLYIKIILHFRFSNRKNKKIKFMPSTKKGELLSFKNVSIWSKRPVPPPNGTFMVYFIWCLLIATYVYYKIFYQYNNIQVSTFLNRT